MLTSNMWSALSSPGGVGCVLVLLLSYMVGYATENPPKYELRGTWISTVVNLDWPTSRTASSEEQQLELIQILDDLKKNGFNTVFFQIRTEADALYNSPFEPWSYWLTGEQGRAPSPFYDPLAFATTEAHKRGMEIHAWLNPYRAHRDITSYPWHDSHIGVKNPHWIMTFSTPSGTYAMLNPGLQEVRSYIAAVVADVVRRYNVDGIHFDDYFYPYNPKITTEDASHFEADARGFDDIGAWRRDNIRQMVKQVNDSIKSVDPMVKFGISPFGIRLNSDAGTKGTEGYHSIYADPLVWLEDGTIDYINPQIYWERDHEQAPYEPLVRFWSGVANLNQRHIYSGMAPYKMGGSWNWPASELAQQMDINRGLHPAVNGAVFFRSQNLTQNVKGIADTLRQRFFNYPALVPPMPWLGTAHPEPVEDIRYRSFNGDAIELRWQGRPGAMRYAVYRFSALTPPVDVHHTGDARFLIGITGEPHFLDIETGSRDGYFYVITAIDRNWNESAGTMILVE